MYRGNAIVVTLQYAVSRRAPQRVYNVIDLGKHHDYFMPPNCLLSELIPDPPVEVRDPAAAACFSACAIARSWFQSVFVVAPHLPHGYSGQQSAVG